MFIRRTGAGSQLPMPQTVPTKPYDWTYTTTYAGSLDDASSESAQWVPAEPTNALHTIPIAELSRPDPILFYAEIPLFEDELHDNGASHLLVRVVRPSFSLQHLYSPRFQNILTECAARDANLHLYPIAFYVARRQRALPRARYAHLSFICINAAARRPRDARMGGAVRACQAGTACISSSRSTSVHL